MRRLTIISAMIVTMMLMVGCQDNNTNNQQGVAIQPSNEEAVTDSSVEQNQVTTEYITQEEAMAIALAHAGVTSEEVSFSKCELDYDLGVAEYEVDFYVGNAEYDYEINAITGAVISYGKDMEKQSSSTNASTSTDYITQEKAMEIALNHAGVKESEISFIEYEFDYDRGVAEYEISFYVGRMEYEYEINAETGAIIAFEKEYD